MKGRARAAPVPLIQQIRFFGDNPVIKRLKGMVAAFGRADP
jgi:hypothetical protein